MTDRNQGMNLGRRVERAALIRVAEAAVLLLDTRRNFKPDSIAVDNACIHLEHLIREANEVLLAPPEGPL